jgi:hypothetical protein
MPQDNSELRFAFPEFVGDEVVKMTAALPQPRLPAAPTFPVIVGDETVRIPYRVYHDVALINHDVALINHAAAFFSLTKQRVASYRACYYPGVNKSKYVGFEIVSFLDSLTKKPPRSHSLHRIGAPLSAFYWVPDGSPPIR